MARATCLTQDLLPQGKGRQESRLANPHERRAGGAAPAFAGLLALLSPGGLGGWGWMGGGRGRAAMQAQASLRVVGAELVWVESEYVFGHIELLRRRVRAVRAAVGSLSCVGPYVPLEEARPAEHLAAVVTAGAPAADASSYSPSRAAANLTAGAL